MRSRRRRLESSSPWKSRILHKEEEGEEIKENEKKKKC
jgi:hypothetical protein